MTYFSNSEEDVMLQYFGDSSDDIFTDPQCRRCIKLPCDSKGNPCEYRSDCHNPEHRYIITKRKWIQK